MSLPTTLVAAICVGITLYVLLPFWLAMVGGIVAGLILGEMSV